MPDFVKAAYSSWANQGTRCNSEKCAWYKYYGAKGVKRLWSARECIDWYINALLLRPFWETPVVSRIGDLGNYCSENCELKEKRENSAERKLTELGKSALVDCGKRTFQHAVAARRRKVRLINIGTGVIQEFSSLTEASFFLGRNSNYISTCLRLSTGAKGNGNKFHIEVIEVDDD